MTTESMKDNINRSVDVIRDAGAKYKNMIVLWAGGKDSTVLLNLIRLSYFGKVPFPVVFIDTTFQFRETYQFIKQMAEMWDLNLVRKRNEEALYDGVNPDAVDRFRCCALLKTKVLNEVVREMKADAVMVGIRWDEIEERGKEYHFSERDVPEHMRVHPILHWLEMDIWDYIKAFDVPRNPLYDRELDGKRYRSLGCWPCTEPVARGEAERGGRAVKRQMERLRALGYM